MNDDRAASGQPEQTPPAPGAPTGPGDGNRIGTAFVDVAVKLIAFLGTGAGFLTFVGVTGAAVTWVRLREAKLPATQTLQLVGINNLVAEGAVTLGLFAIVGLLAVMIVYAIDAPGRGTDGMRHGLVALAAAETIIAIWVADAHLDVEKPGLWTAGVAALTLVMIAVGAAALRPPDDEPRPQRRVARLRRWIGSQILSKSEPIPPSLDELHRWKERRDVATELGLPAGPAPAGKCRRDLNRRGMGAAVVIAILGGGILALGYHNWVGWSAWFACGLGTICFAVALATRERFLPYGLAVFFSVALFGAFLTVVRLAEDPEMSPVALLRTGNSGVDGVVGLFVARTDDRYWLGAVTMRCRKDGDGRRRPYQPVGGSGRIFSIPRSQVLDDEVGSQTSLTRVGGRSLELLRELVKRQPPGGSPPPAQTSAPAAPTASTTGTATTPAAPPAAPAPAAPPRARAVPASAATPKTLAVTGRCIRLPRHRARATSTAPDRRNRR